MLGGFHLMIMSNSIHILLPRAPLTPFQEAELTSFMRTQVKVGLVINVTDFEHAGESVERITSTRWFDDSMMVLAPLITKPYNAMTLVNWVEKAERIVALPSIKAPGRIQDRVWGVVSHLGEQDERLLIIYPSPKEKARTAS